MLPRAKHAAGTVVSGIEDVRRRRTADLVLELDLTEPLLEDVPQDPVGAVLARRRTPLRTVLQGLHRAARAVHWATVREMLVAWLVTVPLAALLAAGAFALFG